MSEYGIQPTGYIRKPLAVILAEIEANMITEFGPGVIQTSQSPLGQLNGLMADLVAEIDERNLDIYQSNDVDQAEGVNLEILGRLRLIERGSENQDDFRKSITNEGQARVDIQDLSRALKNIEGVTYAQVFVNETGEVTDYGLERGSISVAVIGGTDSEIASVMRQYVVPGINTYGNTMVTVNIDGYCRSLNIIRPIQIEPSLTINVKLVNDRFGCPPPSLEAIKNYFIEQWQSNRINGQNVNFFNVRSIIESGFSNVQVLSVTGQRDENSFVDQADGVVISFIEMANLLSDNVEIDLVV